MSQRIQRAFAALKQERRKGLVTFLMGGDPTLASCQTVLDALPAAGADLIEIGMPFSDPMADGPAIQAAGLRALAAGSTLKSIFEMVRLFRAKNDATPLILMGYFNPVYRYGVERFCRDASTAGADGVILVDLPPEEEEEFTSHAALYGMELIRLIAPTTHEARLSKLTKRAGGFLYYIAVAGITGGKSADASELDARVAWLKSRTSLPIAVGFGIKTPAQAAQTSACCDAVVIGSALVEKIKEGHSAAVDFVRAIRAAMDEASARAAL